jgi:membrane protein implicated in regulation of membrane protease activity
MALSWRTRRKLAVAILVIGLPLYLLAALILIVALGDLPPLAQVALYLVLGVAWVIPLRPVFRGVGQPEPEDERRKRGE